MKKIPIIEEDNEKQDICFGFLFQRKRMKNNIDKPIKTALEKISKKGIFYLILFLDRSISFNCLLSPMIWAKTGNHEMAGIKTKSKK